MNHFIIHSVVIQKILKLYFTLKLLCILSSFCHSRSLFLYWFFIFYDIFRERVCACINACVFFCLSPDRYAVFSKWSIRNVNRIIYTSKMYAYLQHWLEIHEKKKRKGRAKIEKREYKNEGRNAWRVSQREIGGDGEKNGITENIAS